MDSVINNLLYQQQEAQRSLDRTIEEINRLEKQLKSERERAERLEQSVKEHGFAIDTLRKNNG